MVFWDEQMTQALPNRIKLGKVSILKGKVDKPIQSGQSETFSERTGR